jgi:glucose/arabinose dehydrogenase
MSRSLVVLAALASVLAASGCHRLRGSSGGGEARVEGPRRLAPGDVVLPPGYRLEVVAQGLTFPTGVAFDEAGRPYVIEAGYSYGEAFATPRLLRVEAGGRLEVVASGGNNGPWNGIAFADGAFWIAEGGELQGGRILRVTPDGRSEAVVSGLPSLGDHHTNGPAIGPDGWIYFGQGTATNSGVVGPDNAQYGWLRRNPRFHDTPCADVTLAGANFTATDPATGAEVTTGAYLPFGTPGERGRIVTGAIPCSGSILRTRPRGGAVELVAWGFRNPFGLAFDARGRLFVTENGFDVRGSRPVWGAPDVLWEVRPGAWYGWPDHAGGEPVASARFKPPDRDVPKKLLAEDPGKPPAPAARLGVNSSSNGLDFSRSERFGFAGEAFVAQFGDLTPSTGKVEAPVGFKVVRVDPASGTIRDFAANRGDENGPASRLGGGGLERPVAVRFDPSGDALWIVDFGVMTVGEKGPQPRAETGVLWRVVKTGAAP